MNDTTVTSRPWRRAVVLALANVATIEAAYLWSWWLLLLVPAWWWLLLRRERRPADRPA